MDISDIALVIATIFQFVFTEAFPIAKTTNDINVLVDIRIEISQGKMYVDIFGGQEVIGVVSVFDDELSIDISIVKC